MARRPRVSVLLPCRNAEATLDEAVASLLGQTLHEFEILAVDDGSEDTTAAMLERWSARDTRIRTLHIPPSGIVTALNAAAARARGSIFARMDADDIAAPERLERQVAFLDGASDIAACGTAVRYFPRRALRGGARRYESWLNGVVSPEDVERDLFIECPIAHPTLAVRRAAFETVGKYRDPGWPEDYDLVLRLWVSGFRLANVPEVLLHWREGRTRLSRVDPRYGADAFRRCKAEFLAHRIGARPIVVWGAGPVGKAFARALLAAGRSLTAFVDLDPRKIGQEIHGVPVIEPAAVAGHRGAYVLAAVGQPHARAQIRGALREAGFAEPRDCCAVA